MLSMRSSSLSTQASRRAQTPCTRQPAQRRLLSVANSGEGPSSSQQPSDPRVVREYKAWGMRVIESNEAIPGPQDEKDFWEGEQFQKLGDALPYVLPGLVVLGIVCGAIAAQTYNEGATVFVKPAGGPDELPTVIPADMLVAPALTSS